MLFSVSVVIPVYNSEATLKPLVKRLENILITQASNYEIILVNDGSRDDSWRVTCDIIERSPFVHGINLMRNYGQHNALLCGIRAAQHEVVVIMDDDLQHLPEDLPVLLAKLGNGYDVVYGKPEKEQHGILRNLASQITKLALQSAMGAETARNVSPFKAFRTRLRDAFATYQSPFVSIDVLLTWGTTGFTTVNVRYEPRRIGKSTYTFQKLVSHALNMMTGFSTLPLQLASLIGFSFTLFGLGVLFYVLVAYLTQGREVPGFAFLASIISIFSGAQLFALGILGEYLARMHFRMMERPPYVVLSQTRGSEISNTPIREIRAASPRIIPFG